MAVSWLIMVQFEKFKIWHAQGSDVDLSDVTITPRVTCARGIVDTDTIVIANSKHDVMVVMQALLDV